MGDSGCHHSRGAGRHLLGDAKQSEMGAFPLGWAKRVRNQPRSHVQDCFSCLLPQAGGWLAVWAGSGLFTSFVAVDPGNCNLQDRFLPNHPRKKTLGNEKHPHVAARSTQSPPLRKPSRSSEGSAAPVLPRARRTRALGVRGQGQGQGREAHRFLITLLLRRRHV